MPPAAPLPPLLTSRAFRGSTARTAGLISRRRLQSPLVRAISRDLYVATDVGLNHAAGCRALALLLPERAVFTGASALALGGVDVVDADAPVEVTVPHDRPLRCRPGLTIRRHRLHPADITKLYGVRATIPLESVWDVAARRELEQAVVLVDAALARWPVLGRCLDPADASRRNRRGGRRAAAALTIADGLAESPMESRLRVLILQAGIRAPQLQVVVRDQGGRFVGRVDLGWPSLRLVVEYDGALHNGRLDSDRDRLNRLVAAGWVVLHVTAERMRGDRSGLADEIQSAVERADATARGHPS